MLDRYETRNVIFECPGALGEDAAVGIRKAILFELAWLEYKSEHYEQTARRMARRNRNRTDMLKRRFAKPT